MKHLKLFFTLFAMLALGVGNAWAEEVTWDLATNSYSSSSTDAVTWSATDVSMVLTKESSSTNANNYLGGTVNGTTTYAHTRVYKNQVITFTPISGITINSIEITATTNAYATSFATAEWWSNATASASSTTVTVTPTDGTSAIKCTIGSATRATSIKVTYSSDGSTETVPSVALSASSLDFGVYNLDSEDTKLTRELTITGENLTSDVTLSLDGNSFTIQDGTVTLTPNDGAINETITLVYEPTEVNTHTATLTISSSDLSENKTVSLTGKAVENLEGTWVLVTDASSLKENDEIIIASKEENYALSTTQNNNNRGQVAITKTDNTITATTEAQVLTLQAGTKEGTLALYTGTGYLYAASASSNYLRTETNLSDNSSWKVTIDADGTATLIAQGTNTRNTLFHNSSNTIFSCYDSTTTTQKAITLYKKVDPNEIIEPQFKLAAGEYYGTQSVTISCATAGAEVYYTLDGTDPTSASTKYIDAISIESTTTVKAIAVKGENSSAVVSATYTILAPLATMQEIFDKATAVGNTATPIHITVNNWVVTGVKNNNVYVTDGTKGLIIYTASHGFNVGDILSGTVACKVQLYNGSSELTELTNTTEGLTVTTGGTVTPVEVTDVTTLGGVNTGSVIKITGPCTVDGTKYYVAGVQLYNSLYTYTNPESGYNYECTGVYLQYNTTKEILPRKAEDLVKIETQQPAGIAFAVTELTAEVGAADFAEPELTNPNGLTVTYKTSDPTLATVNVTTGEVTIGNTAGEVTITASFAGSDDYVAADASYNITITDPNQLEVTFDAKEDKGNTERGEGEITKSPITFACTDGILGNGEQYRIYKDAKATFSAAEGYIITKVVLTSTASGTSEYGSAHLSTEEGTYSYDAKVGTWVGEAYTVTLSATAQTRATLITVYYKQDTRAEAGLAWDPSSVTLTVGEAFTAPTFSNPNNVTGITFASDNEALATVSNAGVISLESGAVGTATITAKFAGNETYKDAEVSCTLTVNPKSEDVVILAKCKDQYYALVAAYVTDKNDVLQALPVEYVNGKIYNVETKDQKASIIWQRVVVDGKTTFKNGDNYLSAVNSVALKLSPVACEWVLEGEMYKIEGSTRTILYYASTGGFKNYSTQHLSNGVGGEYSAEAKTVAPIFAEGNAYHRTVTPDTYGTICIPYGSSNYNGAEFYEVSWLKEGVGLYIDELAVGTALVAGKPYIFKATASEIAIVGDGTTASDPIIGVGGLTGTFDAMAAGDVKLIGNYIIADNKYWVATEANWLDAYRAYIVATDVPTTEQAKIPGRRRVAMGASNGTTGVDNIIENGANAPQKMIENGQLIIIRNGVKYNVQGARL